MTFLHSGSSHPSSGTGLVHGSGVSPAPLFSCFAPYSGGGGGRRRCPGLDHLRAAANL